jgi:hypothetical protein
MRYCPTCRGEFEDWAKECHVCRVPLVEKLPAVKPPVTPPKLPKRTPIHDNIVTIATGLNPTIAHIISSKLKSEGIESFVADENREYTWGTAGASIQVLRSDAVKASRIAESVMDGPASYKC